MDKLNKDSKESCISLDFDSKKRIDYNDNLSLDSDEQFLYDNQVNEKQMWNEFDDVTPLSPFTPLIKKQKGNKEKKVEGNDHEWRS